jgi:hypothetical protein
MANQGGTHDQHVKAGQQSHKNMGSQQASSGSKNDQSSGNRGGSHEQHGKSGQQGQKNN